MTAADIVFFALLALARVNPRGLTGTVPTFASLPRLMPPPWRATLAILAHSIAACLIVNDALKVALIRWRVPAAGG